jgi:signal peptidase I
MLNLNSIYAKSKGNSMYPLLRDGDVIILKPISLRSLHVDDIVTIERSSYYISHRVIYINRKNKTLITKGDNNFYPDKPIYFKQIIGKVEQVVRSGKIVEINNLYLFQSTYYLEESIKINKLLLEAKIPFVFLKGLPIYLKYTKQHPRRIYADCDILINPTFHSQVNNLLLSAGYIKKAPSIHPFLDNYLNKKTEYSYYKVVGMFRVIFDIHYEPVFLMVQTNKLFPLFSHNLILEFGRFLLKNKQSFKINNNSFPLLSTENQIIYLALHLFHDNFSGYYKYHLLEQVINNSRFNELVLADTIRSYKLQNFTYPVFVLLKKRYHPKLSQTFLTNIKPTPSQMLYINKVLQETDIFAHQSRFKEGIRRFKNIYFCSPANILVKPMVFLNPQVLLLFIFVLIQNSIIYLKLKFFWRQKKRSFFLHLFETFRW